MRVLVTGSAGHLGDALMRSLSALGHEPTGIDIVASPFTQIVGSIADRAVVDAAMGGIEAVLHTATLHKPHVFSHSRQDFIDTNVTGTLNLLEAAKVARVRAFIFTSTTSTFGDALTPPRGAPAAWITEDVTPIPKNIYGATKTAAEDLCQLFARNEGLKVLVLRTSRFFPEPDDLDERRDSFDDTNLKLIELLYRRVDIEDVVSSHVQAIEKAPTLGFEKFIVTATTPFLREDTDELGRDAASVLARRVPSSAALFAARGWRMLTALDRVYVNEKARRLLDWRPRYDFAFAASQIAAGRDYCSALTRQIGSKGYHASGAKVPGFSYRI